MSPGPSRQPAMLVASALSFALALAAGTGCNYDEQMRVVVDAYRDGRWQTAVSQIDQLADRSDDRSELVFRLEQGTVHRAAGDLESSNRAFELAAGLARQFDNKAQLRLGQETGSVWINETARAYEGYAYDRVMLHTYVALNRLELGDIEGARVAINRVDVAQREAVKLYQKQIDKAAEARREAARRGDFDPQATIASGDTSQRLASRIPALARPNVEAARAYVNPFSDYLAGVVFLADPSGGAGDRERATFRFRRAAEMAPYNAYVRRDSDYIEDIASGNTRLEPTTYVIFETGLAPAREEVKVELPIFLIDLFGNDTRNTSIPRYFGMAFPTLVPRGNYDPFIEIDVGGQTYRTEVLADFDEIIAQEFRDTFPVVLTRTLLSSGAKFAAAWVANEAVRRQDNDALTIGTHIGTAIYLLSTTRADTRAWQTLPKQIQIASFATPGDRILRIRMPNGSSGPTVQLDEGLINLVVVKTTSTFAPPLIRQSVVRR